MSRPHSAQAPVPRGATGTTLRVAVAVCGVSAVLAPAVSGSQPVVVGAAAAAGLLAAAALSAADAVHRSRRLLVALTVVVVTVAAAAAVAATRHTDPGTWLQSVVALAVAGLLVLQQLTARTVRQLVVCVAAAASLLLHTVGTAPGPALVPVLLVGWVCGVGALVLARAASGDVAAPVGADRSARPVPPEPPPVVVRHGGSGGSSGWATRAAGVVAVSVVTALLAVLLLPQPDGSAGSRAAQQAGWNRGGSTGDATPRTAWGYSGGDLDMRARGDLPTVPVIDVPADSPDRWRVGVLTDYDGTTWRSDRSDGRRPAATDDGAGGSVWDLADVRQDATGPAVAASPATTYDVRLLAGFRFAVAAPGHALAVRPDRGGVAWTAATEAYLDPEGGARSYEVSTLAAPDAVDVPAAVAGPDAPDELYASSTELPSTVTARTFALAEEVTAGATTPAETVAAVEQHLRTSYRYDLDSPVPAPGQDAVDHFLFEARVGFCEHFAAAEVVLLRAVGVPARIATGFSGGNPDGDRRVVTGDRAHAWVEVFVPGAGWLPSDPTPAGEAGGDGFSVSDWVRALLADQQRRMLAAAGVVAAALLGWAGVALWRRRRARRAASAPVDRAPRPPEVVEAVQRLIVALARTGAPTPPAETLSELGRRLPPPTGEALAVAERAVYGPGQPSTAETMEAVRALDATTARLLTQADQRSH